MFENDPEGDGCLRHAGRGERLCRHHIADARRLIAGHWPTSRKHATKTGSLALSIRVLGGYTATRPARDFAPRVGLRLRISDGAAGRLIGDALDLRYRLPQIWTAALAGRVPAYQARRIAAATRQLTLEQAEWVDAQLAPSLGAVSWGRLQTLLEAAIIQADPVGAERQAALAAQERFVRLGRASEHGLKLIIARATAGDAT